MRGKHGFTIVEMLVATILLGVGIFATIGASLSLFKRQEVPTSTRKLPSLPNVILANSKQTLKGSRPVNRVAILVMSM